MDRDLADMVLPGCVPAEMNIYQLTRRLERDFAQQLTDIFVHCVSLLIYVNLIY